MNILLVDDEAELVSAMAERLSMRGMPTEWAETGEQALKMVKAGNYDVAVLDMKMPRMGGLELRRRLAELVPDMKFIFLSGHGSEEDFKVGSAEAESYLIKPVRIEDLVERIHKAME
ncbi:Response regulator receiver domain-containing protein [Paucidesulfovibrio gracilis DSM 16080]|uniref:Response regulator receiver domain-containing protein n=1 Tax=Paucidesulfovibrio gracilis DSM 16080 TaxID=1121449 RepID=A0A1T4WT21_9BACT|nr:response regulator [Paucidesulfovibrio gracilis]SKA79988.1 Response regulator receiver domain-containing protein [Paucidesulfovibrio gracilis DSM 16080]